jgi:hypothetical protein
MPSPAEASSVLELHRADLRELHDPEVRAVEQRDPVVVRPSVWGHRRTAACVDGLRRVDERLDHHDASADRALRRRQADVRPAQVVEDLREVPTAGLKGRDRGVRPRGRVEGHRHADGAPAVTLDDGEALQQVVHLVFADLDGQDVAVDLAGALEVAHSVPVKDDTREAERGVRGGVAHARVVGAAERGGSDQEQSRQVGTLHGEILSFKMSFV